MLEGTIIFIVNALFKRPFKEGYSAQKEPSFAFKRVRNEREK